MKLKAAALIMVGAVATPYAAGAQTYSKTDTVEYHGNPPIFSSCQKWSQAASASFCIGVMPPRPMFGRSWL